MAEWSKAPDSSSGLREKAWVQIPLLTNFFLVFYRFLSPNMFYLFSFFLPRTYKTH
ncbi:hypothetical protein AAZX31_05G120100 [Glycine max]